jgi:PEP-CTERM motif
VLGVDAIFPRSADRGPIEANPAGRPPVSKEIRKLIRKMSRENPLWGAPRIHGELLKLSIDLGETSVSKYMVRRRNPPSQTWRTFLENHVKTTVSIDFFTVPTIRFQALVAIQQTLRQPPFRRTADFCIASIAGPTVNIANIMIFEATAAQTTAAGLGPIGQGGTIKSTWSVTESPTTSSTPPTPEPISFVLFGSGLVGVALYSRRFRRS